MTIDIKRCSSCKKNHEGLEYHKMKKPLFDTGVLYTHYAICPTSKGMILITKEEVDGANKKESQG